MLVTRRGLMVVIPVAFALTVAVPIAVETFRATVEGTFALAYLVFNTIDNLTTQDGQVAVFGNAAAHLRPGGTFVVEVGVPQLQRLPRGERFVPFDVSEGHLGIDEYDVANQGLVSHHYTKVDGQFVYEPMPFRYAWPAELDLMARIAGMRLRDRWGGWNRGISRYRRTLPTWLAVKRSPVAVLRP